MLVGEIILSARCGLFFDVLTLFLYVMLQCLYKCVRHGSTRNFISLVFYFLSF